MRDWDPDQYLTFKRERTQPTIDMVARIAMDDPRTIIDIGCGPGNSTQILMNRWPRADVIGVDKSEKMIERARRDYPDRKWIVGDALSFDPGQSFDIVFSNAAIHWIPQHDVLLQRLFGMLNENGVLAVQVPANQESGMYKALRRVAISRKWRQYTRGSEAALTHHDAAYYYDQLSQYAAEIAIWETIYHHVLDSHQALLDWYRSTGMKPYLDSLPTDDSRQQFEQEVLAECTAAYPRQRDGKIIYPFKRLFFTARKAEQ